LAPEPRDGGAPIILLDGLVYGCWKTSSVPKFRISEP